MLVRYAFIGNLHLEQPTDLRIQELIKYHALLRECIRGGEQSRNLILLI